MAIAIPSDLAAIKVRQQATWSSGDYHMIGTQILIVSEQLIETLDLHSTERVLDVATGSGNAALAAARRGAEVVGIDYVPALIERARQRAIAEAVEATFDAGDAEALRFEDGSFDVVTSVFGSMFAPYHQRTADEMARVTRSGGRIGIVAHTPEGFIGQLFRVIGGHVPPPQGLPSPILWGMETHLRELFAGKFAEIRPQKRFYVFRASSPKAFVDDWRRFYGPTLKAFEAVGEAGAPTLEADILDLISGSTAPMMARWSSRASTSRPSSSRASCISISRGARSSGAPRLRSGGDGWSALDPLGGRDPTGV